MVWRHDRIRQRHQYRAISIVIILGIISLILIHGISKRIPQKQQSLGQQQPVRAEHTSVSGRYLLNGTVVWAREVEKDSRRHDGSYDYNHPFSQLDSLKRDNYDAWTTDLECPITDNVVPFAVQVSALQFNCRPQFLPFANKYFNIYDLANNHTDNQDGEVGLRQTRQQLDKSGAQYFGDFDPSLRDKICEVIALPVRIRKSDGGEKRALLPIAFCAWHYVYRSPRPGEIETMKRYAKVMPVFAFAEMGVEYQAQANAAQQDIAHKIIDQGPNFLIANNPHWVQNTEVYKGKLIVYSTGNFIFDQLDAPETQRGASIDVTMTVDYDENLAKWLALGPSCSSFQDDCLTLAEQQHLSKYKVRLAYKVVASQGGAYKVTRKADDATQKAVEARMNWAQTLHDLKAHNEN